MNDMQPKNILIYRADDNSIRLEVKLEEKAIWLSQKQIGELYQKSKATISEHIKNIYQDGELDPVATVRNFQTVQKEGDRPVERLTEYYNLDMILTIGYRVRSHVGTKFRQWATEVLKDGFLELNEKNILEHAGKISHEMAVEVVDREYEKYCYNWPVPNSPSTNCLVKISDIDGPASDQSNALFTIVTERTVTVTTPNGGESIEGNTSYSITWTSTGNIPDVKIEYSTNSGSSWNTITASTANSGSYNWTVANTPSAACLVKVSDAAGPASDQSNAVFIIAAYRSITVTSPNGGESWEGNTVYSITWSSTGAISNVMIEYSTTSGSSWNTITASTANSGSYNWTVPNTPFTTCLVKISDVAGPAVDQSNALFAIVAYRTITVSLPNGAENLLANSIYPITWTNTGNIPNVMLQYSTNNGSSWNTITASAANSGSYNWTIPTSASTSCLVKVSDTAGPAVDQSNAVFTISNVTYCTSSGTSQTRGYISRVQVGSLDNSSGSSAYTNFTSLTANLTAGSSVIVTLTPSGTTYTEYWKIWIDYNRDGDFADTGENVFGKSSKTAVSGSFTVPSATAKGTTRMRVSMKYNSTPSYCGSFNYGEVEDYTVNIQ